MKIDLGSIDLEQFNISGDDDLVLVTPTKSKHIWREDELHLRSLLTDGEGNVLSSGLPKFFNFNENSQHDEEFRHAFHRHAVTFTRKLDGSLIILDYIDGEPHFRTRGNHDLGSFERPVMDLIREKYPTMLDWYTDGQFVWAKDIREQYSVLFEYTSPDNQIVLPYPDSRLTLLCLVDKETLEPVWDATVLDLVATGMGVPKVEPIRLPSDLVDLIDTVRAWKGQEGVVARFVGTRDGITNVPRMLKIKSTEYIQLHALKFRLEGKVGKLLYLLNVMTYPEAKRKLFDLGIDFEAQSFVDAEVTDYLTGLVEAAGVWQRFLIDVAVPARTATLGSETTDKLRRKMFVARLRESIEQWAFPPEFFSAAMKWYDGDVEAAWLYVVAPLVLRESPTTVRNWNKDEITNMLVAPVIDDN